MKIICIEHDGNNGSRFEDRQWALEESNFTPPSPLGYATTPQLAAARVLMMHHPAGYTDEWHSAPAIVLGTVLRGSVGIQTSDLQTRILEVGDQFLACDQTGVGHRMFEVDDGPYDLALVVLTDAPDAKAFAP